MQSSLNSNTDRIYLIQIGYIEEEERNLRGLSGKWRKIRLLNKILHILKQPNRTYYYLT